MADTLDRIERGLGMIQIDDANYGGMVGTCLIGIVRVEDPNSFRTEALPIEAFQGPAYDAGVYLDDAASACLKLLHALDVQKEEPVHLCRGWVFNRAEPALRQAGYSVVRGKIENPMQDLIEQAAADYLTSIGVEGIRRGMPFRAHFVACLKWLKGGNVNGRALPELEKLAKTGWATYRPWATLPVAQAKAAAEDIRRRQKSQKRELPF
jgi:hypothetical protein